MSEENLNIDEQLLADWLANKLSEEELEQLQQREDYAELKAIVEGMNGLALPDFSEEAAWAKLEEKRNTDTSKETKTAEENPPTAGTTPPTVEKTAIIRTLDNQNTEGTPEAPIKATEPIIRTLDGQKTEATLENEPVTVEREASIWSIHNRRKFMYAAAAVLALLLAAIFLLPEKDPVRNYDTTFSTEAGQQAEATLPDGSTVLLNALSSIHFTESDWSGEREVYLKGEGYFKAKRGRTFTVATAQGSVRVVGTKFNVFARDNELAVVCTEGKVQVLNPKGTEKALIKASEQIRVLNGKMQKREGMDFTPKWFSGESRFKGADRQKVFGEMERQFGVTVVAPSEKASPFSGTFKHDNLEKAVRSIAVPMKLEYEIRNDTVFFRTK